MTSENSFVLKIYKLYEVIVEFLRIIAYITLHHHMEVCSDVKEYANGRFFDYLHYLKNKSQVMLDIFLTLSFSV